MSTPTDRIRGETKRRPRPKGLRYHRYTNFKVISCWTGKLDPKTLKMIPFPEKERKYIERELRNSSSEIRRDIRRLFENSLLGIHYHNIFTPSLGACRISFKKTR